VNSRSGRIQATTAIFLLLVALAVYVAIRVVPPYVDYLYINDGVEGAVRLAALPPFSEEGLRRQIHERLKERGMRIPEQQIVTSVGEGRASARLQWSVPVRLLWYTHVMQFTVQHSERIR
jgi:hypothetical protein